jgi:hypothetical protein
VEVQPASAPLKRLLADWRGDGMLMVMDVDAAGPGSRRWLRDVAVWGFGVVTAIVVNLVSDDKGAAVTVAVAGLGIVGVLFAAYQIRRVPASSALRYYVKPVAVTVAAPVVLMYGVGVGSGYLMFVAVAVVAVGLSGQRDLRTALVTVFAMTAIGGCAGAVHAMLAHFDGPGWLLGLLIVRSVLGVALAVLLLVRGEAVMLRRLDPYLAMRFALAGVVLLVVIIANAGAVRSADDAAGAVVGLGSAVSMLGCGVLFFLPGERVAAIRRGWRELTRELTRERGPGEPPPAYREVVRRVWRR